MLLHGESKGDKIATRPRKPRGRYGKGGGSREISNCSRRIDWGDHIEGVWKVAEKTEKRSRSGKAR